MATPLSPWSDVALMAVEAHMDRTGEVIGKFSRCNRLIVSNGFLVQQSFQVFE